MAPSLIDLLGAAVVLTVPAEPIFAPPDGTPIDIDFDQDATVDLVLPGSVRQVNALPQGSNRILSFDQFGTIYAADLAEGSFIGAEPEGEMIWSSEPPIMSACASGGGGGGACFGNFLGGIEYLGVEFDIAGNTHYGWVEIESSEFFPLVRVHRWAYESEPGVPTFAGRIPEPSALALLLSGLVLLTRRRRQVEEFVCHRGRRQSHYIAVYAPRHLAHKRCQPRHLQLVHR